MPQLLGINHVALEVGSIDEALTFWETLVGPLTLRGRSQRMAFVDMGDQFVALAAGRTQPPDEHRHVGVVVDDAAAVLEAARTAGLAVVGNDVRDPWGNILQIVDYREIQFTKAPEVLAGMGVAPPRKTQAARAELRAKGIEPDSVEP